MKVVRLLPTFATPSLLRGSGPFCFKEQVQTRLYSSTSEEPVVTRHLRLGQLFNREADYVFQITKNMRFYEWERDPVEELFQDLTDSMYRQMHDEEQKTNPYELNQLIGLKEQAPKEMLRKDPIYELSDGQQRLVTLCLLYAALRDIDKGLQGEIQDRLIVKQYNRDPIPRVRLREKQNQMLLHILEGEKVNKNEKYTNIVDQRIVNNYFLLLELVRGAKENQSKFCSDLFEYLQDYVYVYLTIPESHFIARKLVGNARKGQDAEPIDELKAMCIFNGIESEIEQDKYLEKWLKLEEEVGRPCLQDACVLAAQATLGRRCKRDGEIDLFEDFWKIYEHTGTKFYEEHIETVSRKLYHFRHDMADAQSTNVRQQLVFLRDISRATKVKPLEIAIMEFLRGSLQNRKGAGDVLATLERVALLFAATDISLKDRYTRVFHLAKAISLKLPLEEFDLNNEECREVIKKLDSEMWGGAIQKRIAIVAVLRRLENQMFSESESHINTFNPTLEHILPQKPALQSQWRTDWSPRDRNRWQNRLGNLCILNGKKNSKIGNSDFSKKRELYEQTVFPLTRELAKLQHWTPVECQEQHVRLIDRCQQTFQLTQEEME